jgi:hypothetical protein
MPIHFEQSIENKTIWFDVPDDDDASESSSESSTLEVRRQRNEKVNRMPDIHDKVSRLEKVSDQTKQSAFLTLADEQLERDSMQTIEITSMSSRDSVSSDDTPVKKSVYANEDLDFPNLSDQDTMRRINRLERKRKKAQVKNLKETPSAPPMEPTKQFKEQNVVPQDILIQNDALQEAMERQKSKRGFLIALW